MNCVFCNIKKELIINESRNTFTILSNPYLSKGHLLVIPKQHYESILDISDELLLELISEIKKNEKLLFDKLNCSGIDIRQNCRPFLKESKFKVNHLHFHLIPREFEDELYQKSMIFEKEVFKDLDEKTFNELKEVLKNG